MKRCGGQREQSISMQVLEIHCTAQCLQFVILYCVLEISEEGDLLVNILTTHTKIIMLTKGMRGSFERLLGTSVALMVVMVFRCILPPQLTELYVLNRYSFLHVSRISIK